MFSTFPDRHAKNVVYEIIKRGRNTRHELELDWGIMNPPNKAVEEDLKNPWLE